MAEVAVADSRKVAWYRALTSAQWKVLVAANLGWLFDGFETYALFLTVGVALRDLLSPSSYPQIPFYAGVVLSTTLLGWGIGGMIGGILADYIGRKRMMVVSIVAYSLLTGASAFAPDFISFVILRFVVGMAIGSEWAIGASIVAEVWPPDARGKGAGLMQGGMGVGFLIASFTWLGISAIGPGAWRCMFMIGVLPAFVALWVRMGVSESRLWEHVRDARDEAKHRANSGSSLSAHDRELTRFTLGSLFAEPAIRKRTVLVFVLSLTSTLGWWGVSSWVPAYMASLATKAGLPAQQWASYVGMTYNIGGILGYVLFGFFADAFGRKPVAWLFLAGALVMTPVLFYSTEDVRTVLLLASIAAFFSIGQFTWLAVWVPELYPTRYRATAVAFAFNAPRLIACVGPFLTGTLIVFFGSYSKAATIIGCTYIIGLVTAPFISETKGKELPASAA